jgi:general secretion pathway protein J
MRGESQAVPTPGRGFPGGFTLLELLISVTIIGIMVFILAAVLRLGYRSVEAGERKMETLERLRASLHRIEAQFLSEIPMTYEENGERRPYFEGKADRLTFATLYSIWEGEKGVVVVSYRWTDEGPGKKVLWADEKRIGQKEERTIKLLEGLSDGSFAYYRESPAEETGQWVEEWSETAFLPKKVRLQMVMNGKDLSLLLPVKTSQLRTTAALPSSPEAARMRP